MFRNLLFAFWLLSVSFVGATLTAWHSVSLPPGESGARRAVGHWVLAHYLSADCPCSQAVARYLRRRGPVSQASEAIFIIGPAGNPERRKMAGALRQAGFSADELTAEAAAAGAGVEAVPLLEVSDPTGTLRFRGGDRDRNTPPGLYLDLAILSGLMSSKPIPTPRIFGCATSRRLRQFTDPLSLKALATP